MKTIKYNSTGHDVDVLQTLLDIPHNPTHEFNKTTHNAVVDFQKRNGLDADGIVGYKTWEMLFFHDDRPKYGITENDFDRAAMLLDCDPAALKAVRKVETGGKGGFLPSGRPTILFEGHIFWQQLRTRGLNPQNYVKGNEDILHQRLDKSKFVGGVGEWERLERAVAIHEDAALSSASWGMFQIMGFNYGKCGCKSVQEFVSKMKESEVAQLDLFVAFLKSNSKMVEALKNRSWVEFARLYYGPTEYNIYAEKLSKAYAALK